MNVSHTFPTSKRTAKIPPSGRLLAPIAAALPLTAAAMGIGFMAGLGRPGLLIVPVSLLLTGSIQTLRRWIELTRRRREADDWLRQHRVGGSVDARHLWRAAELISPRERRVLARSLRTLLSELSGRPRLTPVPLNRVALRGSAPAIERLADWLGDLQRPVAPVGIVLVRDLLTDGAGPFYNSRSADELRAALREALSALAEPAPARP